MTTPGDLQVGWIGIDLDGTLAHHPDGGGVDRVGKPIPKMVERLKRIISAGYEVRIVTARIRAVGEHDEEKMVAMIQVWNRVQRRMIHAFLLEQGLPKLKIQCEKDFNMLCLYDDRAVQVQKGTGEIIGQEPEW